MMQNFKKERLVGRMARASKDALINKYEFEPVYGYIRVSTEGQSKEDAYGLDMQKSGISRYCMERRMVVVKWYVDIDSGVKADRKAINDMLTDPNRDNVRKVIAFKSDRISRDTKMYFYFLYEMERRNLKLECITEEFDTESEFADLYRSMMMFVAEQERKNILYRTIKGKEEKRLAGGFVGGKVPYGYKIDGFKELELHRIEAWIVQYVFYRFENGIPMHRIATEINGREIKTRKGTEFSTSSIRSILNNRRFYQGYVVQKDGSEISGRHPRLLKDANIENYPADLRKGESLVIMEIFSAFEKDESIIKPSQDILKRREKNRKYYVSHSKLDHSNSVTEAALEREKAKRQKELKPLEEKELTPEEFAINYMNNATVKEHRENE